MSGVRHFHGYDGRFSSNHRHGRVGMKKRVYCLLTVYIACFFQVQQAFAFDEVSLQMSGPKGPVESISTTKKGITLNYRNGQQQIFRNIDHPKNGSPVTYIYEGEDVELNAYVVGVWRVGKQVVLLSKATGSFVEVGTNRSISPSKRLIFSSDCWETGCYYQLNDWPAGKRLVFSQKIGHGSDTSLLEAINPAQVSWSGDQRIDFQVLCSGAGTRDASLSLKSGRWRLTPSEPCA